MKTSFAIGPEKVMVGLKIKMKTGAARAQALSPDEPLKAFFILYEPLLKWHG